MTTTATPMRDWSSFQGIALGSDTYVPGSVLSTGGYAALTNSSFGYSSTYKALVIGATSGTQSICLGYNPSGNSSGGFVGDGSEIFMRNGVSFVSANDANDAFHVYMTFNDQNITIGRKDSRYAYWDNTARELRVGNSPDDVAAYALGDGQFIARRTDSNAKMRIQSINDSYQPWLAFDKAGGTIGTPTIVLEDMPLGSLVNVGLTESDSWQHGCEIRFYATGDWSGTNRPCGMEFYCGVSTAQQILMTLNILGSDVVSFPRAATRFLIGALSAGDTEMLQILGDDSDNNAQISLDNGSNTSKTWLGAFSDNSYWSCGGHYDSGWEADGTNAIAMINMAATNADSSINFNTSTTNGAAPTLRVTINKNGYVGVGLAPTANMPGLSIEAGLLTLKETTTPTADADYAKIYSKNDNKLYFQDGAGSEHEVSLAT